jgi:CubicO group peptidase (beta-lactamase class C family)
MDPEQTLFDVASLSKIIATTTASAILYDQGYLSLDEPLSNPNVRPE